MVSRGLQLLTLQVRKARLGPSRWPLTKVVPFETLATLLQGAIKRDPDGYADEFRLQARHVRYQAATSEQPQD